MVAGKKVRLKTGKGGPILMEEKQQQLLLLSVPIAAPLTLAMGVLSWVLFGEAVAIAVQQISKWLS